MWVSGKDIYQAKIKMRYDAKIKKYNAKIKKNQKINKLIIKRSIKNAKKQPKKDFHEYIWPVLKENRFISDKINVKNRFLFPLTTLCRYNKMLPFRELPYYYNLEKEELLRYPAYFFGSSYDRLMCNFGLWLTTDTKKNINILMPFYYNQDMADYYPKINSDTWLRLRYSVCDSFINKKSQNQKSYSHSNFFDFNNVRNYISDTTLELQKHYNRFHRSISFNPLIELDFSITNYNYNWWKKYYSNTCDFVIERYPLFFLDDSFLMSSFFITSYDTALISYPQIYFESLFFDKLLLNCFNLNKLGSMDWFNYNKTSTNNILYFMQKNFKESYILKFNKFFLINSRNFIYLKFYLFRFLKGKIINFLSFRNLHKSIKLIYIFIMKNVNMNYLHLKKGSKINNSFSKNYYKHIKELNEYTNINKYLSLYDKLYNTNSLTKNTNNLKEIIKNARLWAKRYFKELITFQKNKKNYIFVDTLSKEYTLFDFEYLGSLFTNTDFLFKTYMHRIREDKGMLIYALGRRYCFTKIRSITDVTFPTSKYNCLFVFKYSPRVLKNVMFFYDSIFKFFRFNLQNFISISFNNIRVSLFSFLYYYFTFNLKHKRKLNKFSFIKKRNKFNKIIYNKLLLTSFINNNKFKIVNLFK